jgi:hypothetical protein
MSVRRRTVLASGLTTALAHGLAGSPAAHALTTPQPRVHSTRQWGARAPSAAITVLNRRPTYIVVHHTATANTSDTSRAHAYALSRAIQRFHMDSRGWIDTGQQFTISRGGHITEGRHHSLQVLHEGLRHVQGSNVANHNSEVIGIENEGLYTSEDTTDELWESLVDLVTYMSHQYAIPAEHILGHRDFNTTQCPGDRLYARLPELRATVAQRRGAPHPRRRPPRWPLLAPGDRGEHVLTAQRLLREQGARDVPADGVFGPATQQAVADLAARHGLDAPSCSAARADEAGLLGADIWPLIVTGDRSHAQWKALLAR